MDRIYEAYMGSMGDAFAEKTKKRIHWICENVQGDNVLDVGCSQGITAILLARDGKTVTGLDVCDDAITCAKEYLAGEQEEIQKRVTFAQADFGCYASDMRYDTIIMGEVLEHLLHPQVFLENAWKHLNDHGTLIVTVPFGINDDPDHKHTFYYFELHQLLEQYFKVSATVYFGKWIGFIAHKEDTSKVFAPTYVECIQLEQAFYKVEREFINALQHEKETQNAQAELLRGKLKKAEDNYQTAKEWVKNKNSQIADLTQERDSLSAHITELNNALTSSDKALAQEEQFLLEMKLEIQQLTNKLAAAQENVDRIDEVLYNTWYGRIVRTVYRFLRKVKRFIFKN